MKSFIALLLVSSYVLALDEDTAAEIQCNVQRNNQLNGLTDAQLYNLTQENLVIGKEMVTKRVQAAVNDGFPCYGLFYSEYVAGLVDVLQNGEQERLDQAKTPKEKSDATKILAEITQAMRCDEDWRAEHLNETLAAAKCSGFLESFTSLDLLQFKPKLAALETGLLTGSLGLKITNNVVSGVVKALAGIFKKAYLDGEKCASTQATAQNKCNNIKILVKELDRLFTLVGLTVAANVKETFSG